MKTKRHYEPCRECGAQHTNPASSSICNDCGPAYAAKNQSEKEQQLLEDIFEEGRQAHYNGESENYNPYYGLKAEWWSDGFEDAEED